MVSKPIPIFTFYNEVSWHEKMYFQVWAVVQGMDGGSMSSMGGDGEKNKDALAGSSTVGLLHNKVDKMIRLMVETSENQKKMNKTLGELLKSGFHKAETPSTCKHTISACFMLQNVLVFQPRPLFLTRAVTESGTERAVSGRDGGGTGRGAERGRQSR